MESQEKTALEIMKKEDVPIITQKELDDYLFGSGTKLNDQQKKMFYAVAIRNNLDPFRREVYPIAYGDRFNLVTGYEVYLKRAERSGLLDGWEADYINSKGDPFDTGGDFAYCIVHRKDQTHPIKQKVWLKEFDLGNKMWKEKPRAMLIKVAIATAFRRAFPDEIAGLPYTTDEIPLNGEVIEVTPQPTPKPASKAPEVPPEAPKTDDLREKVQEAIFEAAMLYGISNEAVLTRYSTVTKDGTPMSAKSLDHLMKSKKWAEVTLGELRKAIKEARGGEIGNNSIQE